MVDYKDKKADKRSKAKRVREAIDGKRDFIEDIVGTEPFSGTAEERDKMSKMLARDRAERDEIHRKTLAGFRKRREEVLKSQLLTQEQTTIINNQMGYLLFNCCEPDAFQYINFLREKDNIICHKLCYALFPPKEMRRLKDLVWRIYTHGPPKKKITLLTILRYERAFRGIKTKIEVERDGKRSEIFSK